MSPRGGEPPSSALDASGGLPASDAITVNVNGGPTVAITTPADGTTVSFGTAINFTGTAADGEDGDLTAGITWSSSVDGALGSEGSVNATLSGGTHTMTASVVDSGGLTATATITVTVTTDVVVITKAEWKTATSELKLEATSSDQPAAVLTVVGSGVMDFKGGKYTFRQKPVSYPETVTVVSDHGGSVTATVDIR